MILVSFFWERNNELSFYYLPVNLLLLYEEKVGNNAYTEGIYYF